MAEDKLSRIYEDLASAAEERNAAEEALDNAIKSMNAADRKLKTALEEFAEYLGEMDQSGEGDVIEFNIGGLNLKSFNSIGDIFGDLF